MTYQGGTLEITTAKTCSVNCAPICPQLAFRSAYDGGALPMVGQLEHQPVKPDQFLSLDNFRTALHSVPTTVRICFSGFAEPFMNVHAIDMIEYASLGGYPVDLYSTFRGATPEIVERLRRLRLREIVLHLPDNEGNAHLPPTATYLKTRYLAETLLPLTGISRMSKEFGFVSNERAGNCEGAPERRVVGPFHCWRLTPPSFVMLPNGDCAVCPYDWRLQHIVGNLFRQSWDDLLNSPERQRLIANSHQLDGDVLCRKCKFPISAKTLLPTRENLVTWGYILGEVAGKIRHPAPAEAA